MAYAEEVEIYAILLKSGNHGQKCISTESEGPGAHLENTMQSEMQWVGL